MALSCKVDDYVELVFPEQPVDQFLVADVAFMEKASFVVDILLDGSKKSCIGESIENNNLYVIVVLQQVFHVIGTDKAGSTGN